MSLSLSEGALLAGLFIAQLGIGGALRAGLHDASAATVELFAFAALYIVLGVWSLVRARHAITRFLRDRRSARRNRDPEPGDP